jgi:hypothetical protein
LADIDLLSVNINTATAMYTGRFYTKRQEPVKEIKNYKISDLNIYSSENLKSGF